MGLDGGRAPPGTAAMAVATSSGRAQWPAVTKAAVGSTGQLVIYKGPTVRRSTAARRLERCARAARLDVCGGALLRVGPLLGAAEPYLRACSLGFAGAWGLAVFALPAATFVLSRESHHRGRRKPIPGTDKGTTVPPRRRSLRRDRQLSFIAHCERKYTAAFGAKSSAGRRNTGSGYSGIILAQSRVQLRDAK